MLSMCFDAFNLYMQFATFFYLSILSSEVPLGAL